MLPSPGENGWYCAGSTAATYLAPCAGGGGGGTYPYLILPAKEKEELHRALREMYRKNGMDKPVRYPSHIASPPTKMTPVASTLGTNVLGQPRIGDADRDQRIGLLREAHAGGFIDQAVFDARLEAVMNATMKDELDYLVKDLPAGKVAPSPSRAPAKKKERITLGFFTSLLAVILPALAAITIAGGGSPGAAAVLAGAGAIMSIAFVMISGWFS